jgi:aerotaxis receptor
LPEDVPPQLFHFTIFNGGIMSKTDVQMAILAHMGWKSKLIDHFHGLKVLTRSDVPTHTECKFGQWFYGEGKKEFGHLPLAQDIEREHKVVHDKIIAIVETPQDQLAQSQVDDFRETCDRLVQKMEKLEDMC